MGPRSTKTGRYLAGIPTEETAHLMISTVLNKVSSERTASLQAVAGVLAWNVEGYVQSWGGRVSGLAEGERIASLPVTEHQLLGLSSFAILREVAPDLFHVEKKAQEVTRITLAPEVQAEIDAAPELVAPPIYLPCLSRLGPGPTSRRMGRAGAITRRPCAVASRSCGHNAGRTFRISVA